MSNIESFHPNQAPPKKKMNGCLIAVLVLIGLGVLGVGGCFLITGAAFSRADKEEKEKLEALKTATPCDLSPSGELADIFNFNSKHTDLQRDNKQKEIKGEIVQWDLKVYEMSSNGKTFKIQTHAGVNFMGQSPVGAFVDITPIADGDFEYLTGLKTDDVISFIGYIDGTSMRHLEISPAILYHAPISKVESQTSISKVEALKTAVPVDLRPGRKLAKEIQRGNKDKEIKGQIVQWDIEVSDIESNGSAYRIRTSGGGSLGGDQSWNAFTNITPIAEGDAKYLSARKTGDVVSFIGYIDDISLRHSSSPLGDYSTLGIEISPAILYHASISKFKSQAAVSKLETLKTATPIDLRPDGELADIFNINSNHTKLQRENKDKEIKGKIVQWNLKVSGLESNGNSYRIRVQQPLDAFVDITPITKEDTEYLAALKTDDVVSLIGYIDEVLMFEGNSMRFIEISPAILYHEKALNREAPLQPDRKAAPEFPPAIASPTPEQQRPVTAPAPEAPIGPKEDALQLERIRLEQEKAQLANEKDRFELEKERLQLDREKAQLAAQRGSEVAKQVIVESVETNKNPVTVAPAIAAGSATVPAMSGERYPKTRLQLLGPVDLMDLNLNDLRYAINEMYARRGADFKQAEIAKSFTSKEWYKPRPGVSFEEIEKEFSTIEADNLRLLGKEWERKAASADHYELIDSESNLREGPGTNYPIVRKSRKGEVGEALSNKNGWMKLRFSDDSMMWAHEQNLKTVK